MLHLRILSLRQAGGVFGFFDHLEQTVDFDDILVIDIEPRDGQLVTWAKWNSGIREALRDYEPKGDPIGDEESSEGVWSSRVSLPQSAEFLGKSTAIRLTASRHT